MKIGEKYMKRFIQKAMIMPNGLTGGSGHKSVIEPLTITENGTYTVSEGVDGYSPVTVNVASQSDTDEPYTTLTATVKRADVAAVGVYVEATKGTAKISGITDANGVCVLKLPYSTYTVGGEGTWTISAIKDGETLATSSSYVSFETYTNTLTLFYATVKINCQAGATVTLAKGASVQTATATDNGATFTVESSGEYTATVNYNGTELTKVVTVGTTTGGTYSSDMFVTPLAPLALENTSWDRISAISAEGNPENYFAVGDMKSVYLSGQVGDFLTLDETLYVYILGFNHNAEIEGNGIHFGGFKNANGADVALVDSEYNTQVTGATAFGFHDAAQNITGQYPTNIKINILGNTDDATDTTPVTSPAQNTLMAALPSDLRAVMKRMTKYNIQKRSSASESTYLTIPGMGELFRESQLSGYIHYNFEYPTNQQQYSYYADGASTKKYKHSTPGAYCKYWTRDIAGYFTGNQTVCIDTDGSKKTQSSGTSCGISPIFMV